MKKWQVWAVGSGLAGVVLGIMALDGRFGTGVQGVAVSIRDMTRFGASG